MTVKELLARICDANDAREPKIGLYHPSIVKATRKGTLTTITFAIKTDEFTPEDVLDGLWSALAIGATKKVDALTKR